MSIIDDNRDYVIAIYDDAHRASGEPMTFAECRDLIEPQIVEWLADQPRDLEAEARMVMSAVLTPERNARASSLKRDMEYVLDYLDNPAEGAISVEAMLDRPYRLGTSKGDEKLLSQWTVDDFRFAIRERRSDAAEVRRAADQFAFTASRVIDRMAGSGAFHLGDLLRPSTGAAA